MGDNRIGMQTMMGWPLAYMENKRVIPAKWRKACRAEFARKDNAAYVNNLRVTRTKYGIKFSDGGDL